MKSSLETLQLYPAHDYSLSGMLDSRAGVLGTQIMLVEDARSTSWQTFREQASALACQLQIKGVRRGDRVAVIARTQRVHLLVWTALCRLGAILVPVNPEFSVQEASYALNYCEVSGIFADSSGMALATQAMASLALSPWLVAVDCTAGQAVAFESMLVTPANMQAPAHGQADDPCVIIFTSGSTGYPKGVLHSQRNALLAGEAYVERVHLQADDRMLIVLPFFHMNGLIYQFCGTLAAGCTAILVPKFSASRFWDTVVAHRCTVTNLLVTIANILKARPRSEFRPEHTLRVICGGMQAVNEECFRDEFKIAKRLVGYGMSEIPGVTCVPYDEPRKVGSMGKLSKHPDPNRAWAQCRIVDEAGHDVAQGEVGEMIVKTPIVMLGYFRDPQKTQESFREGWFLTGDLVRQDGDGDYYFVARKKDMFRRRGENISAMEIERVLMAHAAVAEAATIAVPSELGEDEILAAVVLRHGQSITVSDLTRWCHQHMAAVKVPRFVAFVDELPYVGPHKIAKEVLRKDAQLRARAVDTQASV